MFATVDFQNVTTRPGRSWLVRTWRGLRRRARHPAAAASGLFIQMPRHRILRVPGARGQRIECVEGCIWVTMDEDQRDVIIVAGQAFTTDRSQLVLVQALDASRVRLIDPAA